MPSAPLNVHPEVSHTHLESPERPMATSTPYPPLSHSVRRRPRSSYHFLRERELGHASHIPPSLMTWVEDVTLRRLDKGRYVSLDKTALQVRSTISIAFSHDGKFFASTHGDHTVKVFEYPYGRQIACLEGHPRTPWTVRFHPHNSDILASGCLGSDCRVWKIREQKCIRKHHFRASISCVSFSPDGDLLAVTSGKVLLLWEYMHDMRDGSRTNLDWEAAVGPGLPREILEGTNPFHMVDFHPSGTMFMTGEKNRYPPAVTGTPAEEQQFTLRLVIHRFDRRIVRKYADPVLIVSRAVAYNDAGIHFSPCGTMLAACIPAENSQSDFRIAVLSLTSRRSFRGPFESNDPDGLDVGDISVGTVLYETPLERGHVTALTNLKFSSTSCHLLAGFSFRPSNPVLRGHAELYEAMVAAQGGARSRGSTNNGNAVAVVPQVRVVDLYKIGRKFEMIRSLCADMDLSDGSNGGTEDEINVAVFAPVTGVADGVVYGTQKGRIRMFRPATGHVCDIVLRGEDATMAEGDDGMQQGEGNGERRLGRGRAGGAASEPGRGRWDGTEVEGSGRNGTGRSGAGRSVAARTASARSSSYRSRARAAIARTVAASTEDGNGEVGEQEPSSSRFNSV